MVSKVWRTGAVALMGLTLAACGSDPVDGGDGGLTVEQLYGTWEWILTEGGIAGVRQTPDSEGFVQRVVLSDPLQIELFVDGVSVAMTSFTFSSADLEDGETLSRINFLEPLLGFDSPFVGIDSDGVLLFADPCCDGFIHRFTRAGGS